MPPKKSSKKSDADLKNDVTPNAEQVGNLREHFQQNKDKMDSKIMEPTPFELNLSPSLFTEAHRDLPAEELEKLKQEKKTFELPSSWTQKIKEEGRVREGGSFLAEE
ncbi:hypothetical protein PRIPAC_76708 [Pristionchus pacificus]|uniref:Uncharacterized protein n=1 Tax=Pristionchus pacificus TaxID=54126 RepID=A0A2A6C635_PRIPA|nr:hypothetical protein PRIPAC_76708 [Pristionchus pacificus]|eukprot:PDM73576.1 hypothetical protein PRIPAC_40932 [Pristionchus pacificus]